MLPSLPLERKDYKRDDLARASVKLRDPQGQHGSPPAPKPLKRTAARASLIAGPLSKPSLNPKPQGLFKEQRTIKDLLKEDNPELYHQQFNTRDQLDIAISNGGQHLDIAEVFSSLFPGEFVWATTTKDTLFYRFTSTVWERQEDDAIVFNLLSQEVSQAFVVKAASFEAQIEGEQDLAIKEQQEEKAATTRKIARNLRSMPYCRQVHAAITKRLYNASFLEQLDTNLDLLAFKDGVYDLRAGSFRKGRPDDMLSVCVPYNFPRHDLERRHGLLTFLSQIKA
ncbi:TPA: hypothetical protein ACH3X1_006847 [Trebouxia sp. C0004]